MPSTAFFAEESGLLKSIYNESADQQMPLKGRKLDAVTSSLESRILPKPHAFPIVVQGVRFNTCVVRTSICFKHVRIDLPS